MIPSSRTYSIANYRFKTFAQLYDDGDDDDYPLFWSLDKNNA